MSHYVKNNDGSGEAFDNSSRVRVTGFASGDGGYGNRGANNRNGGERNGGGGFDRNSGGDRNGGGFGDRNSGGERNSGGFGDRNSGGDRNGGGGFGDRNSGGDRNGGGGFGDNNRNSGVRNSGGYENGNQGNSGEISQSLPIPEYKMGWVIGKRGSYINQLQIKSGASITISDSVSREYGNVWKYIQISGSGRAVDRAKKLLHIRLERLEPKNEDAEKADDPEGDLNKLRSVNDDEDMDIPKDQSDA